MAVSIQLAVRRAQLQVIADAIDADTDPGEFRLYSGTRPAPGGTPTGVLQCTLILAQPCATLHATDATLIFATPVEGVRMDDETITWGRFVDGAGNYVMDGDVAASAADFLIDSASGVIGALIRFNGGSLGL